MEIYKPKAIARYAFALLYLVILCICALMVIKPGSSFFYHKRTIPTQAIKPDNGYAFRYNIQVTSLIFSTRGVLLYEDGELLYYSEGNYVVNAGHGTYSLGEPARESIYLYFSPTDNSNPITNGRNYSLYIPVILLSRAMGIIYLILLLPGAICFSVFVIRRPDHRDSMRSATGILRVYNHFLDHVGASAGLYTAVLAKQVRTRMVIWKRLFTVTILVSYSYVFMEWLFFVTMPSFMSIMPSTEKVEIVLLSGLFLAILTTVLFIAYIGLDFISLVGHFTVITRYLGALIPSAILSGLALLLVDNFTYTVFMLGISSTTGLWRGLYGLLFIILMIYFSSRILRFLGNRRREGMREPPYQRLFYLAAGLLIISAGLALIRLDYGKLITPDTPAEIQDMSKYPNILLLGGDGINADNLSLYGYERSTTPRIQDLAKSSLVAENAFTNAGNSAGSIISIFTSKMPTQTRVLYPPDILTGINAFQHLPGMLKLKGYTTVELGYPYYIDAYSLNVQNGFDMVNNRWRGKGQFEVIAQRTGYGLVAYFLDSLFARISDRIFHIFYIRDMQNPFNLVTKPIDKSNDEGKVDQVLDLIGQSEEPLFIHVHLIGTHGDKFNPPVPIYSKGEEQNQSWMVDFYDDSIIAFDQYVGKIIDWLKANGQFANTLLIIYSDHAMRDRVNLRVPLIMHFPRDEYAGKITYPVQNMDIAPTILDYLGLPEPSWMAGASIIRGNLDSHRLIFSTVTGKTKPNEKGVSLLDPERIKPPFYQFSYVNVIDCQKWYQLNLTTFAWSDGEVPGYTAPCSEDSLYSVAEIKQVMLQRLEADGFDLSTLP